MTTSSVLSSMSRRLAGEVALITGGASGIGESTARLYVRHGAKVVIANIQNDLGRSVCETIYNNDQEANISYVQCDVSKDSDVENAVNFAVKKHGKLDVMFNNAGITGNIVSSILDIKEEDFKRVFDVNVYGAFLGAKHTAKVMIPTRKGSILFTSSCASVVHGDATHTYTASKHAVVGLTKNLCVELGKYGIRVNCISPFGVVTPTLSKVMEMEKEVAEEVVAVAVNLKEVVVTAEDVAEAAVYFGSDESRYVSGMNLVIDGGYNTTNPAFRENMKMLSAN